MDEVRFDTVICCDFSDNVSKINTISETIIKMRKKMKETGPDGVGLYYCCDLGGYGQKTFFRLRELAK